jgi:peptidoglycan/LPS O-acetylase OafA/YrhL
MAPRRLSQSGSMFLDCLRFGTAMVVFLGHLTRFFPSAADFGRFTHIAVSIFFVLSGFVIRMIVRTRVGTMRDFLIDRASRIYSVLAPALVLTLLFEGLARLASPAAYAKASDHFLWTHVPLQFLTNLTFTAQSWGYETNPLSNSPFWSLSFECVYYILFALLFFGRHRLSMWLLALLVTALAGPAILLLFPTWLIGCVLYDTYIWLDRKPNAVPLSSSLLVVVFGLMFVFRHALGRLLIATDEPHRTAWLSSVLHPSIAHRFADSAGTVPWLSRFSFSFYVASIVVFIVMLWALLTIDRFAPNVPEAVAGKLRWVAEGTFSLYLLHLPILILLSALTAGAPTHPYLWSIPIVVFCILLSQPFNRLKNAMRKALSGATPPRLAPIPPTT